LSRHTRNFAGVLRRLQTADGVVFYASSLLSEIGVVHGFSTRLGGVSPPPFDSLNLGNPNGCDVQDDWPRIHDNYRIFQRAIGCPEHARCWVHQVHGGEVAVVKSGEEFTNGVKADALVGNHPERALAVRVADCVPILLATADGNTVAAVHAGWRGIIADVIPHAVEQLRARSGFADASPFAAAIGPSISVGAFEVGNDVFTAFVEKLGDHAPIRRTSDDKGHVDLREAARLQLLRAGVAADRIDTTDRCTFRDAGEFFSHRRDRGVTGRMAAIIAPRPRA
jgi:YfiH family protein